MIGDMGLHFIEGKPSEVEIGYTLMPAQQGKGYATEAVHALIETLFVKYGKRRIIASADPSNTSSVRLLERVGFQRIDDETYEFKKAGMKDE